MSRFGEVDDQYDPHELEQRVFEYWDDVDAYEQTVEHRADGESYFFVDGPPYTSGSAHMGTTWNKSLKDVYIRFLRMQGYDVTDRPGYDMHGLPIETRVEERLGFENKEGHRGVRRGELHPGVQGLRRRATRGAPVGLSGLRRLDGLGRSLPNGRAGVHGGGLVGLCERCRPRLSREGPPLHLAVSAL